MVGDLTRFYFVLFWACQPLQRQQVAATFSSSTEYTDRRGNDCLLGDIKNMQKNIDDIKAAFDRAAQVGETPVVTPKGLADAHATLYVNVVDALKNYTVTGGQEFGTVSEVAKRMGRSVNTKKDWLRRLEREGKLSRTIQGCPSKEGAKGDTLYHFAEVEEALRNVRKSYVASKRIG